MSGHGVQVLAELSERLSLRAFPPKGTLIWVVVITPLLLASRGLM